MSKTVDDTYTIHWGKRHCMDLYIESLYGSYEMQPVRKVVTRKVLDIVSREASDLCFRKKLSTVLRKTGKDDLMKFSLEQLCLCGSVLLKQRNW